MSMAAPSQWVQSHLSRIPADKPVLDLAAGDGRHTRLLREAGHTVVALDTDLSGLEDLQDDPQVTLFQHDLEAPRSSWPFPDEHFGGIIVTNYLWRPLFPHLISSLAPGGVLIYETFAEGNEQYGKPANPDHLLKRNELLELLTPDLTIIAFQQGYTDEPQPGIRQRVCAIRQQGLDVPIEARPADHQ